MSLRHLGGLVVCTLFLGGVGVDAHHAVQAQFDVSGAAVTLVGTLKKTEWINPHAKLHITVKNENTGQMEDWELQMAAAAQLRRNGFLLREVGDIVLAVHACRSFREGKKRSERPEALYDLGDMPALEARDVKFIRARHALAVAARQG